MGFVNEATQNSANDAAMIENRSLTTSETKINTHDSNDGNSSLKHMCHDNNEDDKIEHDAELVVDSTTPFLPNDLKIQSENDTPVEIGGGFTKVRFNRQHSSAETECTNNLKLRNLDLEGDTGTASETKNSLNSQVTTVSHQSRHSTQDSFMGKTTKSMGIWSRFTNNNDDLWKHQDIDFDDKKEGICSKFLNWLQKTSLSIKSILYTAYHNPLIIVVSFLVFAIILIAGLVAVKALARIYANERRNQAEELAHHASASFSKALDDAGRGPLFAISQFVKHLDTFKEIPYDIGQRDEFGLVAPHLAPPLLGKESTHRDLSNTLAMNQTILDKFNKIAHNIKKDAGLEGILVSLQLAPMGVVSMIYPLINREDFEPPKYMNNTGAIGHDLLFDTRRVADARKTLSSDKPVVAGPLMLIQDTECFIMRLAINMTGYLINVPQEEGPDLPYESWGFAVVLLNWAKAKEKTGLYEEFKKYGMEFSLTRVDTKIDPLTNEVLEKKVVQIANSSHWEILDEEGSVNVNLTTTNNMWNMQVGYVDGLWPSWDKWMKTLVVIIAFTIGTMTMIVLAVRKQYQNLLFSMMPPQIVKRLRKGETIVQMYDKPTIYFSDIVGYTSMSENMTPLEVMAMLNEMYTHFDQLVRKHGIYKVETIGDAYMVIGGGPDGNSSVEGAKRVALFSLDVLKFVKDYRTEQGMEIHLRCGLASGPVVGAVVGISMPKFSIFGDTVNFASRMESTSKPMRIQCNGLTFNMLNESRDVDFQCEERTEDCSEEGIFVKGKGFVKTWWVNGIKED